MYETLVLSPALQILYINKIGFLVQHRFSLEVSNLKVTYAFYTFLERTGRKGIGRHFWKCHFRKWACRSFVVYFGEDIQSCKFAVPGF